MEKQETFKKSFIENEKQEEVAFNLEQDLSEKTKLAEERLNQLKYLQADFDNYRKKFEKEKEDIIRLANEKLIKELLIIVDDFERCLEQFENSEAKNGLILVQRNFFKILEKHGLKQIEALGKKFDPNLHEAVIKETSDEEDGFVLEELQKGFMLKSKVIRPSMVKVSETFKKGFIKIGDKEKDGEKNLKNNMIIGEKNG
jgi:molecular chaperone GrpE